MDDFLQKLKKVVRIVLYGPAISQSDCRKAGPYQLPCNNDSYNSTSPRIAIIMHQLQCQAKQYSVFNDNKMISTCFS